MQDSNIKLESVQDRAYYTKLAMQRYHMPVGKLKYLIADNSVLDVLNREFVEILIRNYANPEQFNAEDFSGFSLSTILEYLKRTHVLYVYKRLPEIAQSIHILQTGCDQPDALLQALDVFFKDYSRHLIEHIENEEHSLFAYVAKLIRLMEHEELICSDTIQPGLLDKFSHDHSDTEMDLRDVRKILRAYLPSAVNQTPYRMLLNRLQSLELDLHIHSRIEEEVLVPRGHLLESDVRDRV